MASEDAIIFINNLETPKRSKFKDDLSCLQAIKMHFSVPFEQLPLRIISSLNPPIFGKRQKINVDLLGPLIAFLTLVILLHYGHANKIPYAVSKIPPLDVLLSYVIFMPVISYILIRFLGQSKLSFIEMLSLLGYALFGHIFTLIVSLVFTNDESNFFFFLCMLIFGGLSTLKIVLILVALIPKPAVRLIICSFVSIVQLLFLMSIHFLYMHRSFMYGANRNF